MAIPSPTLPIPSLSGATACQIPSTRPRVRCFCLKEGSVAGLIAGGHKSGGVMLGFSDGRNVGIGPFPADGAPLLPTSAPCLLTIEWE